VISSNHSEAEEHAMERTGRGRYETSLDDPEFTVMDDGTRFAGFFLGDGEDEPAVFPMEVTANYRFPVHYHKTHYMSIILRGSLRVGKKWYRPGDIRLQEKGSVYGPEEAGPEGCFMLNIFADRRGYFPTLLDQPAQEYPAVEPHIMLSKVWNALTEATETAPSAP
jgi:hypothetical protein